MRLLLKNKVVKVTVFKRKLCAASPGVHTTLRGCRVLYAEKHERTHEDKQYRVVIEILKYLTILHGWPSCLFFEGGRRHSYTPKPAYSTTQSVNQIDT
jgi:hypothetical protein